MSSRKRKFSDISDTSSSINNNARKKPRTNTYNSSPPRLKIKRTFARNRRKRTKTKHLTQSRIEQISVSDDDEADSDYNPSKSSRKKSKQSPNKSPKSNSPKSRKRSPLKLKRLTTNKNPNKNKNKVQSTLDFPIVKKSIFKKSNQCGPKSCNDCGMLYYDGRDEDDQIHSKYHKSFMNKFNNGYNHKILSKFIIWNFQQIIQNVPYFVIRNGKTRKDKFKQLRIGSNKNTLQEMENLHLKIENYSNRNDLILCLNYDEFIKLKKKNGDILAATDMMDRDLGYFTTKQLKYEQYMKQTKVAWDNNGDGDNEDIVYSLDPNQSLYCFVEEKGRKIVGCVVCEPRTVGYKIKVKETENDDGDGGDDVNVERSDKEERCSIGIVKIWVHYEYRKKCVASLLMDCIRKTFIYGTEINKKYIGWCQPTRMGQAFAQKYCQTKQILVY